MTRCAFVGLLALAACSFGPGVTDEIRGRVLDRETGAPVAGAEVFAVWFHVTVGSNRDVFAQWATSNADGGFVIPSRVAIRPGFPLPLESSGGPPRLAVYHPEFALQFFDPSTRSEHILELERPESMRDWRAAVWESCSSWRSKGSCRLHDGCERFARLACADAKPPPDVMSHGDHPFYRTGRLARTELADVLGRLWMAQERLFDREGRYASLPPNPPTGPGPNRRPWFEQADYARILEGLGRIERTVYCQYAATAEGEAFTIEAICDLDGDGITSAYGIVKAESGHPRGVTGAFGRCDPRGVYDPATRGFALGVPGACDAASFASLAQPVESVPRSTRNESP